MKTQSVSEHGGCYGFIGDLQSVRQFGKFTVHTKLFKPPGEELYSVHASAQDQNGKWHTLFDRCDACCAAGLNHSIRSAIDSLSS